MEFVKENKHKNVTDQPKKCTRCGKLLFAPSYNDGAWVECPH